MLSLTLTRLQLCGEQESAKVILTSMLESVEGEGEGSGIGRDDEDSTRDGGGERPRDAVRGKTVRGKEKRQVMYDKVLRSQRTLY